MLNGLLADPNGALTDVLLFHVVADMLAASDVIAASSLTTVEGTDATITVEGDGSVFIEGAQIVLTNVVAANGIVPPVSPFARQRKSGTTSSR